MRWQICNYRSTSEVPHLRHAGSVFKSAEPTDRDRSKPAQDRGRRGHSYCRGSPVIGVSRPANRREPG